MKPDTSAYARAHAATLKGHPLENEALIRAARMLEQARTRPGDTKAFAEALDFNFKLWTVFQADVSDPASPLPLKLREELLSLSLYMDRSIRSLLREFDDKILQGMIDVNRTLASETGRANPSIDRSAGSGLEL